MPEAPSPASFQANGCLMSEAEFEGEDAILVNYEDYH